MSKAKTPKTRAEQGTKELVTRRVTIEGITPLMFDRYPGDNDTKLTAAQKLYLDLDGETITMPAGNLMSFLSAKNTDSAPKRLLDSRKYKKFTEACASFVLIDAWTDDQYSERLPIIRDGEPIKFSGFGADEICPTSGIEIRRDVARLEKGIPNPKERPVLQLPWEITFRLTLYANQLIQEQQLKNIFEQGGIAVGIGTWRGRFGKFRVKEWE